MYDIGTTITAMAKQAECAGGNYIEVTGPIRSQLELDGEEAYNLEVNNHLVTVKLTDVIGIAE